MVKLKKYKCLKCKFPFKLSENRKLRCPNCGVGADMIEEITPDSNKAQKILENSDKW
jgi:Zn finger protein HypA/HybF involved in hydrogenase expression